MDKFNGHIFRVDNGNTYISYRCFSLDTFILIKSFSGAGGQVDMCDIIMLKTERPTITAS